MSLGSRPSWEAAHELPAQIAPEMSETLDHRPTYAAEPHWKLEPQKGALTRHIQSVSAAEPQGELPQPTDPVVPETTDHSAWLAQLTKLSAVLDEDLPTAPDKEPPLPVGADAAAVGEGVLPAVVKLEESNHVSSPAEFDIASESFRVTFSVPPSTPSIAKLGFPSLTKKAPYLIFVLFGCSLIFGLLFRN